MDIKVLNQSGQKIFPQLGELSSFRDTYLAGGTALALQIQHRYSFDLDFFVSKLPSLLQWQTELSTLGNFELLDSHGQGYLAILNSVQISLSKYPYRMLEEPDLFHGVRIAKTSDLVAMKLFALLERARRRDIYDMYFLAQQTDLAEMMIFFEHKYEGIEISEMPILKALSDLDSIPEEPVDLIQSVAWNDVKDFWQKEVKEYLAS